MNYDFVVYLGRFQPFHDGHLNVLRQALKRGQNVIVGIGSANRSRSTENPWTYEERCDMIRSSLNKDESYKTHFIPVNDYPYNDTAWTVHVNSIVNELVKELGYDKPVIGLMGFKKDKSSRYLNFFPNWTFLNVGEQYGVFSATYIRDQYFDRRISISEFIPDSVKAFLKGFALTPEYKWVLDEFEYLREYRIEYPSGGPFFTTDAVVIQMGHILLVTRKEAPFKGKLAIPGGFIHLNEWIADARIRELKEETKLADTQGEIPPAKIQSFIQKEKVYDDPKRSQRGRVITFAGYYKLPDAKELYKVVGSDDAEKADWYSMAELSADMFMEDHYFIIQDMLGLSEGI